jgi:hypothetical protein
MESFDRSVSRGWLLADSGWGLHIPDSTPDWLGVAQDHTTRVFIAKFVGQSAGVWHGYPADHVKNARDVPHEDVLSAWLKAELLAPAKARKILRGQPCNL